MRRPETVKKLLRNKQIVTDEMLHSEVARRRAEKRDYKVTCECQKCPVCQQRAYRRQRRAQGKDIGG